MSELEIMKIWFSQQDLNAFVGSDDSNAKAFLKWLSDHGFMLKKMENAKP